MSRKRKDVPLCPYCKNDLRLWVETNQTGLNNSVRNIETPKYRLEQISLYCSNAKCSGVSITGNKTGYDIRIDNI